MIEKAIVLLPRKPESLLHTNRISPLVHVGGLTIIQRTLYNLQWAGIKEGILLSFGPWPELERLIKADSKNRVFTWMALPDLEANGADGMRLKGILSEPFLLQFSGWIVDRNVIKKLIGESDTGKKDPAETILLELESARTSSPDGLPAMALVSGETGRGLVPRLLKEASPDAITKKLFDGRGIETRRLPEPALLRVETERDRERAEGLLLQGLIKPTESLLSRKFERRISLSITRRLLYTRITPNQISLGSIGIGLCSALLFIPQHRLFHVAGALLLLLSSIIDGCDGELARLRYQESRWGSWLDFLGDNLVHMAVFFCIGFGLYNRGQGMQYLLLGCLSVLSTLSAASLVFVRVILKSRSSVITFATPFRGEEMDRAGGELRKKIEFADKISNRDFIYFILALSALGQIWIFAWFMGLGSAFYLGYLLYLYKRMGVIGAKRRVAAGTEE